MKDISEINTLYDVLPDEEDWKRAKKNPRLFAAMKDCEESTLNLIKIIEGTEPSNDVIVEDDDGYCD